MLKSLSSVQPGFDWEQLNQLAGEDRGFAIELLAMFLKDTERHLAALDRAVANHSLQEVEDVAHTLKGASANVGAITMSELATQMEKAACAEDISKVSCLRRLFAFQYELLHSELASSPQSKVYIAGA